MFYKNVIFSFAEYTYHDQHDIVFACVIASCRTEWPSLFTYRRSQKHHKSKSICINESNFSQFREKPKLGGNELTASFQQKIENGTEQRFLNFRDQNERNFKAFIVSLFFEMILLNKSNNEKFSEICFFFQNLFRKEPICTTNK